MPGPDDKCLDLDNVSTMICHFNHGIQLWIYNFDTHQIFHPLDLCITADKSTKTIEIQKCDKDNEYQKWSFGYANNTALQNWRTFGVSLP